MKRKISILLILLIILTSCTGGEEVKTKESFSKVYYGPDANIQVFDTAIVLLAFTETEEEFNKYYDLMGEEFLKYHKIFDRYKNYEGINNVKTINDNAGIEAVQVDDILFDVIKFSIDNYEKSHGKNNIAIGTISNIWADTMNEVVNYQSEEHDRLQEEDTHIASDEIEVPEDLLPSKELLDEAKKHTNIEDIILDEEKKTVFIKDKDLIMDLGSVAKGYATELVAKTLEEAGLESGIISAGGNVRTIGVTERDNAAHWAIGIAHPRSDKMNDTIDTLFVDQTSVVTSGDYQRYFMANGKRYHHIIDPDTGYPPEYFSSVTIVTDDSGLADYLSTVLFLVDEETGREIISQYDVDIEVLWVDQDNNISFTEGLKDKMLSEGADNEK